MVERATPRRAGLPATDKRGRAVTKHELHPDLTDRQKADLFEEGIAFFDAGRFFEAHEPWEEIWRSTNPEPRDFYQGLVQVAAGLHIWLARRKPAPAARVLGRGVRRLRALQAQNLGIDIPALVAALEPWQSWLAARPHAAPPQLPTIRRR
jgi:predicted metal-dependent hydrolase